VNMTTLLTHTCTLNMSYTPKRKQGYKKFVDLQ
jgi:hypothetical protein